MNPDSPVADTPNLATRVVHWITSGIIDGRWSVNERLNEVHIAEELGVSRAPVREALRILGEQGMITHVARVGSVVNEFTPQTVEDLYAVRAALESWCARVATENLSVEQATEVTRFLEPIEAAWVREDPKVFYAHAWRMRETLYRAAGNQVALPVITRLRERLHSLPNVLHGSPEHAKRVLDLHRELVAAVNSRDATAVAATIEEILTRAGRLVSDTYRARRAAANTTSARDLSDTQKQLD